MSVSPPEKPEPARNEQAHEQPPQAGPPDDSLSKAGRAQRRPRVLILGGVAVVAVAVLLLYLRAEHRKNHVALTDAPRPVTVVRADGASYRALRSYVGNTQPWSSARVGPQYVSAYVGTVLVRPGANVKRGQVLATLDCRYASAASKAMAARAAALEARQSAAQHETNRTKELTAGGFASPNEIEQLSSRAESERSEVESLQASLIDRKIEVDDCILRAPFDGEVSERYVDPGAYLRPGEPVALVLDRNTLRVTADAPESDFAVLTPGVAVEIELEATHQKLAAHISRRAPGADAITRTVHFEVDVPNPEHLLPTGATARVSLHVGGARPAVRIPLHAATVRGDKASIYLVEGGRAKRVEAPVLGESGGDLFLDPTIVKPGSAVVIEGRALLDDGDAVEPKESKRSSEEATP
jgi:membrane fusion protein, multidrug efflux system